MTNKKHSLETRKKMSEWKRKPDKIVVCPKCNKSGGLNNMTRYHFSNCGKKFTTTCPHCGLIGGVGIMHRWHFDNCKKIK